MQTRIKIAVEAMVDRPEIRAAIEEQIGQLEQRLGSVRACGVTIKGPGPQRTGRFEVTIRLAVAQSPEIKVGPPPQTDPRYNDVTFAIGDTFRRATRRLRDQARAQQGRAKKAEPPADKHAPSELRSSASDRAQATVEPAAVTLTAIHAEILDPTVVETTASATNAPVDGAPRAPEAASEGDGPDVAAPASESALVETAPDQPDQPALMESAPDQPEPLEPPALVETASDESEQSAFAETASDRLEQPARHENAIVGELAAKELVAKEIGEAALLDLSSAIALASAEQGAKATPPVRLPTLTPLAFLAAMGNFVRTAAVLNLASTSMMHGYFARSAGMFNPMRPDKPSSANTAAKTLDATKA